MHHYINIITNRINLKPYATNNVCGMDSDHFYISYKKSMEITVSQMYGSFLWMLCVVDCRVYYISIVWYAALDWELYTYYVYTTYCINPW